MNRVSNDWNNATVVLEIEDQQLSPRQARRLAQLLLSAADKAEDQAEILEDRRRRAAAEEADAANSPAVLGRIFGR